MWTIVIISPCSSQSRKGRILLYNGETIRKQQKGIRERTPRRRRLFSRPSLGRRANKSQGLTKAVAKDTNRDIKISEQNDVLSCTDEEADARPAKCLQDTEKLIMDYVSPAYISPRGLN